MKLFKNASSEQDLFEGMQKALIKNAASESSSKKIEAIEYLNKAAELLDQIKFGKTAEIVTRVMEKIASSKFDLDMDDPDDDDDHGPEGNIDEGEEDPDKDKTDEERKGLGVDLDKEVGDYEICDNCGQDHEYEGPGEECRGEKGAKKMKELDDLDRLNFDEILGKEAKSKIKKK